MNRLLIILLISTIGCVSFAEGVSEDSRENTNHESTYELFIDGVGGAKCVGAIVASVPALAFMGATQSVAFVWDILKSINDKSAQVRISKCVAFQNRDILQNLIHAGCMITMEEMSLDSEALFPYDYSEEYNACP